MCVRSTLCMREVGMLCWDPCISLDLLQCYSRLIDSAKRFRGGLVFKAHRLVYHSTIGSSVIKKKKNIDSSIQILG